MHDGDPDLLTWDSFGQVKTNITESPYLEAKYVFIMEHTITDFCQYQYVSKHFHTHEQ